jgi:hypothetical protein
VAEEPRPVTERIDAERLEYSVGAEWSPVYPKEPVDVWMRKDGLIWIRCVDRPEE